MQRIPKAVDFEKPELEKVDAEFVDGSITDDATPYEKFAKPLPANPSLKYFESLAHGYVSVVVTHKLMQTSF